MVELVKVDSLFKNCLYFFNYIMGMLRVGYIMYVVGGVMNWDYIGINWISDMNGDVCGYMNIDKFCNQDDIMCFGFMMSFYQVNDGNFIFGQG